MSLILRIVLLIISTITAIFVIRKIKKSQFVIEDTIFWLLFCIMLLIMSIFPKLSYFFSNLIGIQSPVNFIFLVFIFLLLIKVFFLSVKISKLETKFEDLVHKYTLKSKDENK